MPRSTSQNFRCQCHRPHGEPQALPASSGDPPIPAGRPGSVSHGVTAPSLGPDAHTTLCASSKIGASASPSPVDVLQSNPASLPSLIL